MFHFEEEHLAGETGTKRHHKPEAVVKAIREEFIKNVECRYAGHVAVVLEDGECIVQFRAVYLKRVHIRVDDLHTARVNDEVFYIIESKIILSQKMLYVILHGIIYDRGYVT